MVNDLIFQLTSDILDCIESGFATASVDLPDRRYVHQGEVALDCPDQLVVSFGGLVHTMPGGAEEIAVCAPPRSAVIDVWLSRCVPVQKDNGNPPTPTQLTDSAEQLNIDAWVLANVLFLGYQSGCWGGGCVSVLFGPVVPYGPEGEAGGVHATLTINLTGLGATVAPS